MRILVVTRGLPFHQLGGMEAVAWQLSRAFAAAGADVTVLTTKADQLPCSTTIDGVKIETLDTKPGRYSGRWWRESRAIYEERFLGHIDVVLSISAAGMSIAKSRKNHHRSPIMVAQAHGTSWGEIKSKLSQPGIMPALKSLKNVKGIASDFGYRKFDAMVAVGPIVQHDLSSLPTKAIVGELPIHCIPNGIDVDALSFDVSSRRRVRENLGINEDELTFVSACRLHPQKGVSTIINAFNEATTRGLTGRLLVLGDGPERQDLIEQVSGLGIDNLVSFLGHVKAQDLPAFLSAGDAFVFATKRVEGLPMNILEALANGMPVIASKHLHNPELPTVLIDPNQTHSLANAMLRTTKREDRESLLDQRYTLNHSVMSYFQLFERILSVRKPVN